jgi:hypothetical protein
VRRVYPLPVYFECDTNTFSVALFGDAIMKYVAAFFINGE